MDTMSLLCVTFENGQWALCVMPTADVLGLWCTAEKSDDLTAWYADLAANPEDPDLIGSYQTVCGVTVYKFLEF